jgi:hypothetical protein
MRRAAVTVTALLLFAGGTACSKSHDEMVDDCYAALDESSSKTNRPEDCEELSADDYGLILAHWTLKQRGMFDGQSPAEDLQDFVEDAEDVEP